jgi:hypothetical protein
MACLILLAYLKTTYRGFVDFLSGHQGLRTRWVTPGQKPNTQVLGYPALATHRHCGACHNVTIQEISEGRRLVNPCEQ